MKEQTLPLLKPPYLLYFVICCCLQYGIFCIAGGLALFLPDILNKIANAYDENPMNSFKICDIIYNEQMNLNSTKFADRVSSYQKRDTTDQLVKFLNIRYNLID